MAVWLAGAVMTGGVLMTIWPILLALFSVNHTLPSGPAVIRRGKLLKVGTVNSVIAPAVVIVPILLAEPSVNQRLPSEASVIPTGPLFGVRSAYSVIAPAG